MWRKKDWNGNEVVARPTGEAPYSIKAFILYFFKDLKISEKNRLINPQNQAELINRYLFISLFLDSFPWLSFRKCLL